VPGQWRTHVGPMSLRHAFGGTTQTAHSFNSTGYEAGRKTRVVLKIVLHFFALPGTFIEACYLIA
jgi:hypothetical protein